MQTPTRTPPREFAGLWVTRWDYRTPQDVERIMDDAAALGFTDVIWQVRGQGDAFYPSTLEPWGRELMGGQPSGASGPGFDPLALAVDRAHANGLRLHAWVNVFALWKGKIPPEDPRHPYNAHPRWRLYDAAGKPQPLNDHYVIFNPVLPEVHDHITAVCRDIVRRYRVDGLHLDYVRFVSDTMKEPAIYPGDPVSVGMFTRATKARGVNTPEEKAAFRAWIRDRITALVQRIRLEVVDSQARGAGGRRREVMYSAAVVRQPASGRDVHLQDGARWLKDGTLDRVFPMLYTTDNAQFSADLNAWLLATNGRPVTPGIGTYLHMPQQTPEQIALSAKADGTALFAYSSIFESGDPNQKMDPESVKARADRREAIRVVLGGPVRARSGGWR